MTSEALNTETPPLGGVALTDLFAASAFDSAVLQPKVPPTIADIAKHVGEATPIVVRYWKPLWPSSFQVTGGWAINQWRHKRLRDFDLLHNLRQ